MNTFEKVKRNVTARQAAERYGIKVNRHGMARCPFHNDKNPSMKVDKRYHCFACQANGDVIDLVTKLYGLSPKEAALKLAGDFGITVVPKENSPQGQVPKSARIVTKEADQPPERVILKATLSCFHSLASYLHMLQDWQKRFAPQMRDAEWDPRFIEALQKRSYVEYLLDILLWGTAEEKAALLLDHGKEVAELDKQIAEQKKTFP